MDNFIFVQFLLNNLISVFEIFLSKAKFWITGFNRLFVLPMKILGADSPLVFLESLIGRFEGFCVGVGCTVSNNK